MARGLEISFRSIFIVVEFWLIFRSILYHSLSPPTTRLLYNETISFHFILHENASRRLYHYN